MRVFMADHFDFIVVGSGAAGAWAAARLKNAKVLMLDVGEQPEVKAQSKTLGHYFDLKQAPEIGLPILIGDRYESLHNIFNEFLSPKLKSPYMRYIIKKPLNSEIQSKGFYPLQSFAKGGLANGWGGGCYRFQDDELQGFPINANDLEPYYKILTKEIGISGVDDDDLQSFYGKDSQLLPPIPLPKQLESLYNNYKKKRFHFNSNGFHIGFPRFAYQNYTACGLDYFLSQNPSIYTPAYTVEKLVKEGNLHYINDRYVEGFSESNHGVEVYARGTLDNCRYTYNCKALILAMGAINSGKCVLSSYKDLSTHLPLLDNNLTYVPFLWPKMIGASCASNNIIGSPLTSVYRSNEGQIQLTIYNMGNLLCSDLLFNFPLSGKAALIAGKYLIPALIIIQVFYPDNFSIKNYLQLNEDGSLSISYERRKWGQVERELIKMMRSIGLFSAPSLIQAPTPGNSIHYAGTLPMKPNPKSRYETDKNGRLNETKRVFVADSATFPYLPAKNHTFTIMANAMRIADGIEGILTS
jgi:choline dehydrogenase-like flavoprotein